MAIDAAVQRLEIGDVILIRLPEQQESEVEAKVIRKIDRTETTVRATLRVQGHEDFLMEWPLGELVTVVRGP
jgi:protein involved in polysaccharide export with SLBB domain